jgi:hypothetical protein
MGGQALLPGGELRPQASDTVNGETGPGIPGRSLFARHRPLHEIPLHPGLQLGATWVVVLQPMSQLGSMPVPDSGRTTYAWPHVS